MWVPSIEANESELRERLTAIVRSTPMLMRALSVARRLCLPDWLVFSGAVYQPVLNQLRDRPLDYGIKDYDLGYFDASALTGFVHGRRRFPLWRSLLRLLWLKWWEFFNLWRFFPPWMKFGGRCWGQLQVG